jgi:ribosome-associated protein
MAGRHKMGVARVDNSVLFIEPDVIIARDELQFRFSRSAGPGGQNVNRTATRVELLFDVAHSPSLKDEQRELILQRLRNQIDKAGVLHVVAQSERSQWQNREQAVARLAAMLAVALRRTRHRVATRPTHASRERRLQQKRRQAQTKAHRQRVSDGDW